jgi:hypothetical protein
MKTTIDIDTKEGMITLSFEGEIEMSTKLTFELFKNADLPLIQDMLARELAVRCEEFTRQTIFKTMKADEVSGMPVVKFAGRIRVNGKPVRTPDYRIPICRRSDVGL